ncbi:hypothetical protein SAMN07250955_11844 [Arboricoccus pini]|uniref:Uncharacterized protein n=1 Tax=Arboricoccus pini TaxID=1963835 RepID=A0A212RZX7_9PROT|nr:hypothetical protein [Arboricoccus pini]SNB78333.1 hypothetical protein SAMN07250955_11844 [Arboricoccus pini]
MQDKNAGDGAVRDSQDARSASRETRSSRQLGITIAGIAAVVIAAMALSYFAA